VGYSTDRYVGYGINLGDGDSLRDSPIWELTTNERYEFFPALYDTLDDFIADYPLLSLEFNGDSRNLDGDIIIAISSTVQIVKNPLGATQVLNDAAGEAQLETFIKEYLSLQPKSEWLFWEYTV
jgi:hypothetical protein